MKTIFYPLDKRRSCWAAVGFASLACGAAMAQTNSVPSTNAPPSATSTNTTVAGASTNATVMEQTTVVGKLNEARRTIVPSLGATQFNFSEAQIAQIPQGEQAQFNQILLRAPGVAEDSLGQVHLRGEHANIQYRIDDVLLPEGITGFGQEIDTRFVQSMSLITGALPAEYGFRTAGVVDIQTKSGAFEQGGQGSIMGGSYDTISPSFSYGGSEGKLNYYFSGSFLRDAIGIENPTASAKPIHDYTDQYKAFAYLSYVIDDTSRVTAMGSAYYGTFEIPINPGLQPVSTQPNGDPWITGSFTPFDQNDHQNEDGYYGVVSYQKSVGDLNLQVAGFGRASGAHYTPEVIEPVLFFNSGVATDEKRDLISGGLQADASYKLNDSHTLRGGGSFLNEYVTADTGTTVFPVDPVTGNVNGAMETILQNNIARSQFYDLYLQDEWKVFSPLTINYGGRLDLYSSSFDHEFQFCPRVNGIFNATDTTTLHAGYAHYFTPPPLENVPAGNIGAFQNTSGAVAVTENTPVQAERADYFDAGITQTILPGWQVGVDGYYKTAKNQLDDGFFGQSLILSAFNYAEGRIHGVEFTTSYTTNNWSVYANVAWANAQGKGAASAQFLWPDTTTLNYVNNHWIALDHDQRLTGSFGASYLWQESVTMSTRPYVDALYGSGLRQDGGPIEGTDVPTPNGGTVPSYYSLNLGIEQDFKLSGKKHLKARVDVVNVTDHIYQLRSGSGVGVNAAQYGERRGFFGTLSFVF